MLYKTFSGSLVDPEKEWSDYFLYLCQRDRRNNIKPNYWKNYSETLKFLNNIFGLDAKDYQQLIEMLKFIKDFSK